MEIFCLNPVIIQSHTLAYSLSLYKRYHTPNGIVQIDKDKAASYRYFFPKYQYSCKRLGVTCDNVDEFYVITFDGETIPMFMVVPCGKCTLCRDKKKREWSFVLFVRMFILNLNLCLLLVLTTRNIYLNVVYLRRNFSFL